MGETNSEWKQEQERVDNVIKEIDKKIDRLEESTGGLKKEIINLRESFWEDVTVNLDEPDDVIETHTSLRQQAELLAERERTHGGGHQQLKILHRLRENPYFGRINFKEEGEPEESIYLGISSLMNDEETDFLIYDWRAPISSLYYDFSPGHAVYQTPGGTIEGDMTLKRQFIIRNGLIKGMFDTGITIGDEMLQEVLSNQSSQQMKSIVATIQKEQNRIIRNTKASLLVVQGAAGSGKTSAALQRIAFLLYHFRESLNTSNMILFSPNPLFNSYVATVLPELGEENITQTTFLQYLEKRIGNEWTIEDPFEQLEAVLNKQPSNKAERLKSIQYKASLSFKRLLDEYISHLSQEKGLYFKALRFRGDVMVSSEAIADYFYSLDRTLSIPNRIEHVADWLYQKTREKAKQERNEEWVEEAIGLLDKETYAKVHHKIQKRRRGREASFDDQELEEQLLKKMVVNRHFKKMRRSIKAFKFIDYQAIYTKVFENFTPKAEKLPEDWTLIGQLTIQELKENRLYFEDATPFLYLMEKIEGQKRQLDIRHIFIDEAQDYTPFQMAFIKESFPVSKFTVLGDFSQSIFPHALQIDRLFDQSHYKLGEEERINLMQSYRSTFEITEFTKGLLGNDANIIPFSRHGKKPTVNISKDSTDHLNLLLSRIGEILREGHQTVAVICKTAEESRKVYEALHPHLTVQLMTQETASFHKGVLVLPTYLAKGIEFDAVIIFNASEVEYGEESLRRLFYTACTRAMHELHLLSNGPLSPFVKEVPDDRYSNIYSFFHDPTE
ncbi:RNA polymerase recycling motor HelD [Pullulanibacillus sp. KACC 23026]|uniref:RNA polymerase recycling motor HelD n=1 Tax=Pullulanibacillus sp. KACC 23026 TaxID=3028315 RepID=UPI0023B1E873|nr:RNA polymerase recycling motor HelD [Pullulanibacillus sp. KACC 23026]WEG10802.1 RNA polymerase recycling motor HelD [Pullulanibacillus sp. KACC 23026]